MNTINKDKKPIVHFIGDIRYVSTPYGEVAFVHAINHPILGNANVRTSIVVRKTTKGFVTQNTIYHKKED